MDVTTRLTAARLARLLLLAVLAGIAWCVLSLASAAGSASADDTAGSGLLGTVGSVVSGAGGAVSDTATAVDDTLTSTVEVVAPVTEAVPVTAPVVSTVHEVAANVDTAVQQTDEILRGGVDEAAGTVSDIAQAEVVSTVVDPVVDVVTEIPVAGALVEQTGLAEAAGHVADGLDATVSTVVGTAPPTGDLLPDLPISALDPLSPGADLPGLIDAILPELPGPADLPLAANGVAPTHAGLPAPVEPALRAASPSVLGFTAASTQFSGGPVDETSPDGPVAAVSVGGATPWSSGGASGPMLGGVTSASSGSAGTGAAATFPDSAGSVGNVFTTFRVHIDDALPGAPVFDTDVAPD